MADNVAAKPLIPRPDTRMSALLTAVSRTRPRIRTVT